MKRPTLPGKAGYIEAMVNGKAVYRNAVTGETEAQEQSRKARAAKAAKLKADRTIALIDYLSMMTGVELPEETEQEVPGWNTRRNSRR